MKKILLLILPLFLLCCKNNDDEIDGEKTQKCLITNFNKSTITLVGQTFYTSEFIYDGDKIIKRIDYNIIDKSTPGQIPQTFGLEVKQTITVEYNSLQQAIKIIQPINIYNTQTIDNLSYDNLGRLSQKNRITTNFNDNSSATIQSKYNYNSVNKIILIEEKTTNIYGDIYNENTQSLTYDVDENLRVIEKKTLNNPNIITIIKYDNYDTHHNPYYNINVPFDDTFIIGLSKHNHKKYSLQTYLNGAPVSPYESNEISSYEYNTNGYPNIALYKCN